MSKRDPRLYLDDMLDSCRRVEQYVRGLDHDGFLQNHLVSDAVVRNLEIIGEAASRLPQDWRQQYNEIPWQDIIGFRNIAAHGYFQVDLSIVWEITRKHVPELLPRLEKMLSDLDGED